ncbi:GNAT family N-acetyltransferase [Kineococcus xinjiangensis]|uniref:GNAT family N-acetyltransferase n=1 Tax=Kineococcus xinjiangensis TaxID=512762 RepID=UPI000CEC8D82
MSIAREPFDAPDGARLRAAQRAELDVRYGSDDHEPGTPPSAADVPVFLVARDRDGTALGCGGLRPLEPAVSGVPAVEVKRMFVVPAARGTGVAVALLRALEEEARLLGVRRVLLETGTAQPDAVRFYEREGYLRTEAFGPYRGQPLSVCYARDV